jgi:predicted RNA-binding protein with PUA-like domain
MACWLLKTEPTEYSFADLLLDRETAWTGVTNPQALANLRAVRAGDRVAIYHSGEKRAVGVARISRAAFPDPEAGDPKRVAVGVRAVAAYRAPVPLEALRAERAFAGSPLLRQGRLSVVPLTAAQWKAIERLGKRRP